MTSKLDIINSIYKNLNIDPHSIFFSKWGSKEAVPIGKVFPLLLEGLSGPEVASSFNRGEQTFNRAIRKLFPEVRLSGGQSWCIFLQDNASYKECISCKEVLPKDYFNNSVGDRTKNKCKLCQSDYWKEYYSANKEHIIYSVGVRRAKLLRAIPPWADLDKIKEIYKNCPEGYHVDHIYPLQGSNSCGLHVENNLQYLPAIENLKKGNRVQD